MPPTIVVRLVRFPPARAVRQLTLKAVKFTALAPQHSSRVIATTFISEAIAIVNRGLSRAFAIRRPDFQCAQTGDASIRRRACAATATTAIATTFYTVAVRLTHTHTIGTSFGRLVALSAVPAATVVATVLAGTVGNTLALTFDITSVASGTRPA